MAYQNINQYNFRKWYLKPVNEITDLSLASDEKNYNQEVVFSPYLIAETYGEKLPVYLDLNDPNSNQQLTLNYGHYDPNNVLVSTNYYTGLFDLNCTSAGTICDVGLTGIDNGLTDQMTGKTLHYTNGFFTSEHKFDRLHVDRRMKFIQVTGNTRSNLEFSGISAQTLYEVVTQTGTTVGRYEELYGGFYQGFYKLYGYDYDILPERMHQGWTAEFLLKPRLNNEYIPGSGLTTLNQYYPDNKNIFFYMGTRAEDKFYHFATGHPKSDSGYTRVTSALTECLTCDCSPDDRTIVDVCHNTEIEIDLNCTTIYPISGNTVGPLQCGHSGGTSCGCENEIIPNQDADPLFDSMSNALAVKFSGDPSNPKICVRTLVMTGDCSVTGSCETSGLTYVTGYTVHEYCSTKGIWDNCSGTSYNTQEHWVQVDVTWKRYAWFDDCDLDYLGGLGQITTIEYAPELQRYTIPIIEPPITHSGLTTPTREVVALNEKWLETKKYRKGQLIVSVNGKRFFVVDDVEEIIPRALDTMRQRQVGVPFNMSWGGGTQGLHENLTLTACPLSISGLTYQQDPECFPNYILSGTSLSGLTTDILLERYFAGTFEGGISQFRFYIEPLSAAEIRHNFNVLKGQFSMYDPFCPSCTILPDDFYYDEYCAEPSPTPTSTQPPTPTPTTTTTPTTTPTTTMTPTPSVTSGLTPTPTPNPTTTPTKTPTQTPTPNTTPTPTASVTPTPSPFQAYLFAEPQDSNSSISLGEYMYNNGALNFFGFGNSGVPSTSNYQNDLVIYANYEGFKDGGMGNFITPITSLSSYIRSQSGSGVDSFGCPQNQYTFGSIEVTTTQVNPSIEYFYSIWIPLQGVGGIMNNMSVDISMGSPCDGLIVTNSIPSPSLSAINVNVPSGAAIPSGIYRVLWMPTNGLQPPGLPMNSNLYFKGNSKF